MSVYYRVLQGVEAALAVVPGIPTLSIRKRLLLLPEDGLPIVLIAPALDHGEAAETQQFGAPGKNWRTVWTYPLTVALISEGNRNIIAGLPEYLDLREQIRNALWEPTLVGVAELVDASIVPQPVIDGEAFKVGNYDVSGWQMEYKARETQSLS